MRRRSYFLFPDIAHIRAVIKQLRNFDIPDRDMHVVAPQLEDEQRLHFQGFPMATPDQRRDLLHQLEHTLWHYNCVFRPNVTADSVLS